MGVSSCVTFGLMAASLGPMIILVNSTPDQIPADVILEAQEVDRKEKLAVVESSKGEV